MRGGSARSPSYDELAAQLADARATLDAVKAGAVDGLLSAPGPEARVIALAGADRFFRTLVTEMQEGTASVDAAGTILYANPRFAELLGLPLSKEAVAQTSGEAVCARLRSL